MPRTLAIMNVMGFRASRWTRIEVEWVSLSADVPGGEFTIRLSDDDSWPIDPWSFTCFAGDACKANPKDIPWVYTNGPSIVLRVLHELCFIWDMRGCKTCKWLEEATRNEEAFSGLLVR